MPCTFEKRTCRPGKNWVQGLGPEIGKNSSRDWSRNWPHRENREKTAQNPEKILIFPHFSPVSQAGPISGLISRAIFFLFRAGGPKPIFYQVGRFSTLKKKTCVLLVFFCFGVLEGDLGCVSSKPQIQKKDTKKRKWVILVLVAFQTQTQNRRVLAMQFPKSHPCPRW